MADLDNSPQVTYQDFDRWLIEQAKALPTPRGDRTAQGQAAGEQAQGSQQAQLLNQEAQGIFGPLTSFAQNQMTNPQGFGPAYGGMVAQTGAVGSGVTAAAQQEAAQRGAASGNLAGISGTQDAIAQAASQGVGSNLQNLAVQNQLLKNQQQMQGAGMLQGIYGTNLQAGLGNLGQSIDATKAYTEAGKSGWLQNTMGVLGTLGGLGMGAGSMMTGLYGAKGALGS